ncbi:MAG: HAD family phosphatase [Solobacterium sp.]|nr:HAD family phosphatase [Solobacterium sp.]
MIRAILLDIDGTLASADGSITPRTKDALLRAQDAGIRLVLASGRADQGLYRWADELHMREHDGLFLCYNGARCMHCATKEIYFQQTIPADLARAVLHHIRSYEVHAIIARDEYMYTDDVFAGMIHRSIDGPLFNVIAYEARSNGFLLCEKRDMAAFVDFPVEKILTFGEPAWLEKHWEELRAPFADTLSSMFTAPFYYEYTAKDVDKGRTLETVFAKLGYAREELMAFGDAQNDLSMLKYAGLGIAMGNAAEEVKKAADAVTLSNNEDGIAAALEKYLMLT